MLRQGEGTEEISECELGRIMKKESNWWLSENKMFAVFPGEINCQMRNIL